LAEVAALLRYSSSMACVGLAGSEREFSSCRPIEYAPTSVSIRSVDT
jgi:hypothetical protein